ncbi:tRNA (uracil-5-)-methyltransferase homolog A isoform X2 [Aethina tumida]|uniref:tRNA (uracil-5-)-methyltransferase homolog A isoform X2 n=1 Tax=Aethina tumida TaxID=116153 RepID=UPI00214976E9|nr:tRNA (uracil-5-)-methyltransferase homolog A isoform X2 [Aethina tumida]
MEFRKLLNNKLKLNTNKIKTPRRNSPYAFVCFRNDEDRENAIQVISNYKWKGNSLQAIKAKPIPDPLVKKRKEDEGHGNSNKKAKFEGTQEERLKSSTIPFWNVEYSEQLKYKDQEIKQILKKLGNDLHHHNGELRSWLDKQKKKHGGLPCELLEIRSGEPIDGYRNKCEFSVGTDEETNLPTVGFKIGAYVNGVTGVGPVDNLKHIPESMKIAVKVFQEFVRKSDLQVFNPELHTGHFRQLAARSAPEQLMLVVGIHPQNLSKDKLEQFKKGLIEFFANGDGKVAKVTSLYYQAIVKKQQDKDYIPPEHLYGDTHIYETILGLKFRISPEAFFQVNTPGAEILYKSAIELAAPTKSSTVLDVCCGTGTIGLCFADKCDQVLGLEIIPQAIVDAKENALFNKIENTEFYPGKAEEILGQVCYKSKNDHVIAIVDPPRAGLQQKAIQQLRKIKRINRLVYVSCNPSLAMKNFVDLGRPESKTLHGDMFVPVKAVAVDMFPHTKHCELVICFDRWENVSKQDLDAKKTGPTDEAASEESICKETSVINM